MFISKKEKNKMLKDIQLLNEAIIDLIGRVMKLEGWAPVKKDELFSPEFDYVFKDLINPPKKRGRPVGSKNKEKV